MAQVNMNINYLMMLNLMAMGAMLLSTRILRQPLPTIFHSETVDSGLNGCDNKAMMKRSRAVHSTEHERESLTRVNVQKG